MNANAPSPRARQEVVIVDCGIGNVGSVVNMIRHIGGVPLVSNDADVVAGSSHLILPGVGNFSYGMARLQEHGLVDALHSARQDGSKILGICLGMQLMTRWCEEGMSEGLGWFDFESIRFSGQTPDGQRVLVPHMGWNRMQPAEGVNAFASVPAPSKFYFVHSYYVNAAGAEGCLATTEYGGVQFASVIGRENVLGVQFHPEKSHKYGIAILRNYLQR